MRKQFYSIGPSAFPIRGSDGGSSDTMQEAQQQKRAERERGREGEVYTLQFIYHLIFKILFQVSATVRFA